MAHIKLINLLPLQEIDFSNQKSFDAYNKQHKLRPDTKITIAGKTTTAGKATQNSTPIKGTSVFAKDLEKNTPTNTNFDADVDTFIKQHPINKKNYIDMDLDVKKSIEDKLKRPLTPQEKSKITKIVDKHRNAYGSKQSDKFDTKIKRETEKRINNNLLPTSIPVGNSFVSKKYYDGPFQPVVNGGYGYYRLKDKYENTPVDDKVAKQHWGNLYKDNKK